MSQKHNSGQLCEGLCDVEVAQRADLKEGHAQALCIGLGLLCGNLPLECQVKPIPHQDFRDTGGMLRVREARKMGDLCEFCCWYPEHTGLNSKLPQIHIHPGTSKWDFIWK